MKKGEVPQLSAKWWKVSQPKGLASGGKLELVLKAHEVAVAGLQRSPKDDALHNALDTLEAVRDAVGKAVAEAAKAKGNQEMEFTVQALRKIDFGKETAELKSLLSPKAEEEDEAGEDDLKDPKLFARFLRKSLSRVSDDPWNWGFLVGKKPVEHRLLLHRSKNGRALAQAAAKALGRTPKLSFGTAVRSPDDDKTLVLTVQGAMLAGLATRCEKMLLKMKPQTIGTVLLMVDGQIVPETLDPDDVDEADDDGPGNAQIENPALEALHRRIAALEPKAASVMDAMPDYRERLTASIQKMMAAMAAEDVAAAEGLLGKLEDVVGRLGGAAKPGEGVKPEDGANTKLQRGRLAWDSTRKSVTTQLKSFEAAIIVDVTKHNADPASEDEFDLEEVKGAMPRLYRVLERYDERLSDKLDQALNAAGGDRSRLSAEAAAIVKEYQALLTGDDELARIDGSGLGAPIRPVIEKTLAALATIL